MSHYPYPGAYRHGMVFTVNNALPDWAIVRLVDLAHSLPCPSKPLTQPGSDVTAQHPRQGHRAASSRHQERCHRQRGRNTHFHADFLAGHLEPAEATGAWIGYGQVVS